MKIYELEKAEETAITEKDALYYTEIVSQNICKSTSAAGGLNKINKQLNTNCACILKIRLIVTLKLIIYKILAG